MYSRYSKWFGEVAIMVRSIQADDGVTMVQFVQWKNAHGIFWPKKRLLLDFIAHR